MSTSNPSSGGGSPLMLSGAGSSDVSSENIQKLLTALLRDRYCSASFAHYDSCTQNFMFEPHSDSYVEASLLRKAVGKCEPFHRAYAKCLQNPKNQNDIIRSAVKVPACLQPRRQLEKCQRFSKKGCERESEELLYCGLSYLLLSGKE